MNLDGNLIVNLNSEHPEALAVRLLGDGSEAALGDALAGEETRSLPLPRPVPVWILYFTAWTEGDGVLRYGPDVYGFDRAQAEALRGAGSSDTLSGP